MSCHGAGRWARTARYSATWPEAWMQPENWEFETHTVAVYETAEDARMAPVEEGVGVPSSGPGGERVLPLQVHHRRWSSRQEPSRAGE